MRAVTRAAAIVVALPLIALALHTAAAGGKHATAAVDKTAPDFSVVDIDGKTHKLSDYKGKYVVLEWNNPDCPFVRKHYGSGNMQALQKEYGEKGIVWLTICSSAPGKQGYYEAAKVKPMLKDQKFASAAYLQDADGTVGHLYGAKTTPHMYIIDPEGTLLYAGAIDDKPSTNKDDIKGATNYVRAALDAALAGETIEVKTSTPYGCAIKYAAK